MPIEERQGPRREGMLRASREARELRRGAAGDDTQFYEDYGFAMTPKQHEVFHGTVTGQEEAFAQQRESMEGLYTEHADPYKEALGGFVLPDIKGSAEEKEAYNKLWREEDTITVHSPYKGRTGSLGEIPKSMYGDFAASILSAPDVGKRTSILPPSWESENLLTDMKAMSATGNVSLGQLDQLSKQITDMGYSIAPLVMLMHRTESEALATAKAEEAGGEGYGDPLEGRVQALLDKEPINYKSSIDRWIEEIEEDKMQVITRDQDYWKALFYEMPNLTSQAQTAWGSAVQTQYEDVRQGYEQSLATLDTEYATAEAELQGYIDEFDLEVGKYATQYEEELAQRQAAFKGLTV